MRVSPVAYPASERVDMTSPASLGVETKARGQDLAVPSPPAPLLHQHTDSGYVE